MRCLPVRVHPDEVIRLDVFATHFHATRAEVLRAVIRLGIGRLYDEYKAAPDIDILRKTMGEVTAPPISRVDEYPTVGELTPKQRATLEALDEHPTDPRGFTEWKHEPDEFDRQAEEDARGAEYPTEEME